MALSNLTVRLHLGDRHGHTSRRNRDAARRNYIARSNQAGSRCPAVSVFAFYGRGASCLSRNWMVVNATVSASLLIFRVAQSCFGALGDAVITIGDVQHCRPRFGVVHLLSAGASLFGAVPPVPGNRLIMLISTA